jgi:hypothetical protein
LFHSESTAETRSLRSLAYNKRVSGFGASHLRPNPRFARTSDTRQTLSDMADITYDRKTC